MKDSEETADATCLHGSSKPMRRHISYPSSSADSVPTVYVDVKDITLDYLRDRGLLDLPLYKASKNLGRSVGSLKKICRSLGLIRWPYRQRSSLRQLMAHTAKHMDDVDEAPRKAVMETLNKELDDVQGIAKGITASTRRFRQTIFKLNYEAKKKQQRGKHPAGNGYQMHAPMAGLSTEAVPASCSFVSNCALEASLPEFTQPMGMNRMAGYDSPPIKTPQLPVAVLNFGEGAEDDVQCQVFPQSPGLETYTQPLAAALSPSTFGRSYPPGNQLDTMYRRRSLPEDTRYSLDLPGTPMSPRPQSSFPLQGRSLPEYTQYDLDLPGNSTSPRPLSSVPDQRRFWPDRTSYQQPGYLLPPRPQSSFVAQQQGGPQSFANRSPASQGSRGPIKFFSPSLTPAELQWLMVPRHTPTPCPPLQNTCAPAPGHFCDPGHAQLALSTHGAAASHSPPAGECPCYESFDDTDFELMSALDLLCE